jgi:hypothetical protein
MAIHKPRRQALSDTKPAHTFALTFTFQNCEKISLVAYASLTALKNEQTSSPHCRSRDCSISTLQMGKLRLREVKCMPKVTQQASGGPCSFLLGFAAPLAPPCHVLAGQSLLSPG